MSVHSNPDNKLRATLPNDSRHDNMLNALREVSKELRAQGKMALAEEVKTAAYWLRQWVEPWMCPDCGTHTKVPFSDLTPRVCIRCGGKKMFPYAYLEQERMNRQALIMLSALQKYAQKRYGHLAQAVLKEIGNLQLRGETPRGASMPGLVNSDPGGRSWWKFWERG